jgi:AcrR family transcriptional regulator
MASTRQSRSEAKRVEILKIATDLFLAKGYDGVSVDAIVARAGGTKTNVYKHFGGKAELFAAVIEELCQQIVHSFADIELDGMDPEEGLREIGRRFLTALFTQRSVRQHRIVVAESVRFPSVGKRWFKAGPESARDPIAAYFTKLQKAGRLRSGVAPRRLAGLFLDMLSEEQLLRQLIAGAPTPSTREVNKLVDDAVGVFLYGASAVKKK